MLDAWRLPESRTREGLGEPGAECHARGRREGVAVRGSRPASVLVKPGFRQGSNSLELFSQNENVCLATVFN